MDNVFEKYEMYIKNDGVIIGVNQEAFNLAEEAFSLFKQLYNLDYGSIEENENLISIHTGGWSDNESLIYDFQKTSWWFKYHEITRRGGHYYFDTDFYSDKKWIITSQAPNRPLP